MSQRGVRLQGREGLILVVGLWSLAAWGVLRFFPREGRLPADREAVSAAEIMADGLTAIRACRESGGPPIDRRSDPNRTGLIGLEDSLITTSPGQIEAKRTTTNPNFAAALVHLFRAAGARHGDAVAIGASSSFPGLILATLAASKAMGLRPLLVASLGASNWGANDPGWTWLEIAACLVRAGIVEARPIAVSVGGEGDEGRDMPLPGRLLLETKIRASGVPQIAEGDLASDVAARVAAFEKAAAGAPLKVFVNVGGSWANMGTDAEILKLKPGLNLMTPPTAPERSGLIREMAGRGKPVIHLLYVKGLADQFGLPWDPVPLPAPGEGFKAVESGAHRAVRPAILLLYVLGALLAFSQMSRRASR